MLKTLPVFYVSCFFAFVAGHTMNYSAILYSLEMFDSSAVAGIAYGLCFGPPLILGWVAGAYIDRYGAKNMLLLGQCFFLIASMGILPLSLFIQTLDTPSFFTLVSFLLLHGIIGCAWAFVAPARMAVLAQYVQHERLHQATILFNLLIMVGFGIAPVLLTWVLATWDWKGVYTMALSMFLISTTLLAKAPQHVRIGAKVKSMKEEWRACFAMIKAEPILIQLLIAAMIGYLAMGPLQVLLPQIAQQYLGLDALGQGRYLGLIAISLVVGGLIAMKLRDRIPVGQGVLWTLALTGIGILLTSNIHTFWPNAICLLLGMTFGGMGVSFIVAGLQHFAPHEVRGRIMSMYTMISQVIPAAAGTLAGVFAQMSSPQLSLSVIALLLIAAALLLAKQGQALRAFKAF